MTSRTFTQKYKTILVKAEVYEKLKELKEREKVKSFSELIEKIINNYLVKKRIKTAKELLELIEKENIEYNLEDLIKDRENSKKLQERRDRLLYEE